MKNAENLNVASKILISIAIADNVRKIIDCRKGYECYDLACNIQRKVLEKILATK